MYHIDMMSVCMYIFICICVCVYMYICICINMYFYMFVSICTYIHAFSFLACLKMYADKLTTFEQAEILDFPEIWFLGLHGKKIEGVPGAPTNNGTPSPDFNSHQNSQCFMLSQRASDVTMY